ncbi:MAG: A/G-specific adenine glycosylase [Actinomycetota bacterium]|nr:A/G-specific adenine glycosylase [Actinomycetota bacterium]
MATLPDRVLGWYDQHARDLPWRSPETSPWGVLVSEFMLQQTPVSRVLPVYETWLAAWPTPADLAAVPAGEAVRAWGRLGYPRRALRLHAAAVAIVAVHDGEVPGSLEALRELPGVGDYTAAAVASFAFGARHAVLDTNVRRVLARHLGGRAQPPTGVRVDERLLAETLLPHEPSVAARWAVAVMELGALVCTAASPRCTRCPVAADCAWRLAGSPAADQAARRQAWAGTDRQCRGRLMAVLRAAELPVPRAALEEAWSEPVQRERCLDALVADGLVEPVGSSGGGGLFALPGTAPH